MREQFILMFPLTNTVTPVLSTPSSTAYRYTVVSCGHSKTATNKAQSPYHLQHYNNRRRCAEGRGADLAGRLQLSTDPGRGWQQAAEAAVRCQPVPARGNRRENCGQQTSGKGLPSYCGCECVKHKSQFGSAYVVAMDTVINCMIPGISIMHHPVIMFLHVRTGHLSGTFLNCNLKAFDERSPPKFHDLHLIQFKETRILNWWLRWMYVNCGIFQI